MRSFLGSALARRSSGNVSCVMVSGGIVVVLVSSPLVACELDGFAHTRFNPYGASIAMNGPATETHDAPVFPPASAPLADVGEDAVAAQSTSSQSSLIMNNAEPQTGSGPLP